MLARALPWLLVLPVLLLAAPFSPLAEDPYPHLAGTGIVALCALPLALVVLVRGTSAPQAWPFLLVLAWALVSRAVGHGSDGFEARRALCLLALLPLAFTGGATLDERGRASFARLLMALSGLWTAWALWSGFRGESFAGVLGDTGSLSQAALPGAAIAAAGLARARGARRATCALVLGLFLVHVAAAPVLAGSHTLLAALLLASWRAAARGRGTWLALALVALLAPFAGMAARTALSGTAPTIEGAPAERSHSLGGLAVRARVWTAALGLVRAHPVLGAGPGQFQAAFPPYRDPREIELSRHGVCSELDTEVEHAHNDAVQALCELGLVGGALFVLGLLGAARAALRALADEQRLPLAMAALALLVNACVHAPLSANPAASFLALALFGSLSSPRPRSRAWAAACALPGLGALAFVPALITHGSALVHYVGSARRIDELAHTSSASRAETAVLLVDELERARAILQLALAAAPDSAPARELAARVARETERPDAWRRVLEVRPNSATAWEQSATEYARAGDVAEARARYRRALELSPTHPRLLANAARLECTAGELELGLERVRRLREAGCLDPAWTTALGEELVLVLGLPGRGAPLLFAAAFEELSPEELHARAQRPEEAATADGAECLAQLAWARAHAAAGAFGVALRNYRQAAERSHARRGDGPAALYALELGAAEARAGQREKALERVRAVHATAPAWRELPEWARATLTELGVAQPR